MTLIETLIVGLISVLLGAALWTLLRSTLESRYSVMAENDVISSARQMIDIIADGWRDDSNNTIYYGLRGATPLSSGAGALTAATATSFTYTYKDIANGNAPVTVRYYLSGTDLKRQVNGAPSNGTVVLSNVQGFSCVYWSKIGSSWTSSSAPTDLTKVGAVDITITIARNGASRQVSGSVQIRSMRLN
jgi:type II secretory pathway pseudopilin PulG